MSVFFKTYKRDCLPGNVKTKSLKEKCEADPLIVFVESDLIILWMNIFHSRVGLGASILICDTRHDIKH